MSENGRYHDAKGRELLKEEVTKAIKASIQKFFDDVVKEKSQ
ncbi:MAG: hypothetical protein N3A64_01030 [Desulfobacterota bacterium]|nr:hypothetical protein [Thermodesulfobacteriota bacterium]